MPIAYPYKFSDWYGYDKDCVTLTSFWSGPGQTDAKFLCAQALNTQRWHDGSAAYPAVGDTVYNNSSGTTTTAAYKYSAGASNGGSILGNYTITGTSGVVSAAGPCFP